MEIVLTAEDQNWNKIYIPFIKTLNRSINDCDINKLTFSEEEYKKIVTTWFEEAKGELKKYSYDFEITERG